MGGDSSRIAVYTGSFDPVTLGHLNIVERSRRLVDRLVVGVGVNSAKTPMFTPEQRVAMIEEATRDYANVEVKAFRGLAVAFVRECGASVMIRGVRSLTDVEHEFTMTLANRKLDPGIETVWITADEQYSHVSSSLIRQLVPLAAEDQLSRFLPLPVVEAIRAMPPEQRSPSTDSWG